MLCQVTSVIGEGKQRRYEIRDADAEAVDAQPYRASLQLLDNNELRLICTPRMRTQFDRPQTISLIRPSQRKPLTPAVTRDATRPIGDCAGVV